MTTHADKHINGKTVRITSGTSPKPDVDPARKIRVAHIGAGRIAEMHFQSVEGIPDHFELVAVCDVKPERAQKAAARFQSKAYTDYRAMLDAVDADLVVVSTPNHLHYPMGMDVARSGRHLLMEKPITLTLEDNDALIDAFESTGKKLFAVKQVRYNPPIQVLKDAVDSGRLGRLLTGSLVMRWTRPQEYFDTDEWRGKVDLDGGGLINQGIHYVDILQWLFGPVASVFGKIDTVGHDIEIEDVAHAIISFKNGAYVNVEFTTCTYPKNLECSIAVLGTDGTVKLGGTAVNEIELWEVKNYPKPVVRDSLPPNVYAGGMYQGSCPNHIFVYHDIVKALKENGTEYTDGTEARKSLEIVLAIYRSARENREVRL